MNCFIFNLLLVTTCLKNYVLYIFYVVILEVLLYLLLNGVDSHRHILLDYGRDLAQQSSVVQQTTRLLHHPADALTASLSHLT